MISLEDVRDAVITSFRTVHNASYPTVPVNYPNYFVVDIEHFTGSFFVNVSLNYGYDISISDLSGGDNIIKGTLEVSTVTKYGTGTKAMSTYSNMLMTNFLSKTLNGVNYTRMRSLQISPYPGYIGIMNIIEFICI